MEVSGPSELLLELYNSELMPLKSASVCLIMAHSFGGPGQSEKNILISYPDKESVLFLSVYPPATSIDVHPILQAIV